MPDILTGSCLCGSIAYRIEGEIRMAGNCHCTKCKKITGGAFQSFALAREQDFTFSRGEQDLAAYRISERLVKHFCPRCGTGIYNRHVLVPGKLIVQLGTLDDPGSVVPTYNLHCENMLPWVLKIDRLQSFEKGYEK